MVSLLMLCIQKSISTNLPLVNVVGTKCWDKVKSVLIAYLPFQPKVLSTVQIINLLMVSILGYSEIILSDISLYELHRTWTHTFLCHETKNLVNLQDDYVFHCQSMALGCDYYYREI